MNTSTTNWFSSDVDSIIWLLLIAFLIYAIISTKTLDIVKGEVKKRTK